MIPVSEARVYSWSVPPPLLGLSNLCPAQARVPFSDLLVWQKVNHFPEAKQLTRKDLLKKHLVRYQVANAILSLIGARWDMICVRKGL